MYLPTVHLAIENVVYLNPVHAAPRVRCEMDRRTGQVTSASVHGHMFSLCLNVDIDKERRESDTLIASERARRRRALALD